MNDFLWIKDKTMKQDESYERKQSEPHRDCELNLRAGKWFLERYHPFFQEFLDYRIPADEILYIEFKFTDPVSNEKVFIIQTLHVDFESFKNGMGNIYRKVLKHFHFDSKNLSWDGFLREAIKFMETSVVP